ncbi:MAG: BLUF domain-containing protein [Pseudomonadota bacterium]
MLRIFYISAAKRFSTARELSEILAVSRERNLADNISGVLLYNDGSFAQVLEGPEEAVRNCYARIQADQRHSGCTKILEEHATERYFEDWALSCAVASTLAPQEQNDFMTLSAFQESPQFRAAQKNLILKSFLTSFLSKPEIAQKPHSRVKESFQETPRFTGGVADDFIIPQFTQPTNDSPDQPTIELHAIDGRPAGFRNEAILDDGATGPKIDNRKVGIASNGETPLAGDSKNPAGPVTNEINNTLQAEPAASDMMRRHWNEGLRVGHAGRRRPERVGFFLKLCGA